MGRKAVAGQAMTNAERQSRWRQMQKQKTDSALCTKDNSESENSTITIEKPFQSTRSNDDGINKSQNQQDTHDHRMGWRWLLSAG